MSIPQGRCGFTLKPEDLGFPKFSNGGSQLYERLQITCCWRPTWNGNDRCIWHAEVKDKPVNELATSRLNIPERLDGAFLHDLDMGDTISFSKCWLRAASIHNVEMNGVDFSKSVLTEAEITESLLLWADFTDTVMYRTTISSALADADFTDADVSDSDFSGIELTRANLIRTNCFDVDFTAANFYGIDTTGMKINDGTQFGNHRSNNADKEIWMYKKIEELSEKNALPKQARWAYKKRKDIRRITYRENIDLPIISLFGLEESIGKWKNRIKAKTDTDFFRWIRASTANILMRYGESPWRILITSMFTIFLCGSLYPYLGFELSNDSPITYPPLSEGISIDWMLELIVALGNGIYFSIVTFTTLGYGDMHPVELGRVLAVIESLLGTLLMALLVFVLGRRATW